MVIYKVRKEPPKTVYTYKGTGYVKYGNYYYPISETPKKLPTSQAVQKRPQRKRTSNGVFGW